jgi:DNA-directed RNA polymerase specialized sigma24 family protein
MDAIGDPRPDPDLLAAALAGDGDAFGAFYRRHVRRIAAFHLARAGSAQDAADLTAETFADALAGLHRFDAGLEQVEATVGAELVSVELRDGLGDLPADQRDAVALRVLLDHDYAEVAAHAGVSEAVARKRVSRGLSALRARLAGRDPS